MVFACWFAKCCSECRETILRGRDDCLYILERDPNAELITR